jgi:TusA-related sulfurtransferase
MALIGAVREAPVGATIEVLSSDPGSQSDIPAWVAKAGMSMELVSEEDGYRRFVVRKSR